jgi:hypothetical protein
LDRRWIHWVYLEWSKRVAGIITGAITRFARTPTIGSSVVTRVAGRAGVAWIVAGFTGFVAGEVKWSKRVAELITGAIKQSESSKVWLFKKCEEGTIYNSRQKRKKNRRKQQDQLKITRSARTPTSGSSVVARVAGRAGVAWIVAGFTGLVAGEVKWSKRVAELITGAIKQSK